MSRTRLREASGRLLGLVLLGLIAALLVAAYGCWLLYAFLAIAG